MRLGGIVRRLNKTLEDVRNKLQYIRLPNNIDSLSSNLHALAVWLARDDHLIYAGVSLMLGVAPALRAGVCIIYAAPRNFSCAP